MILGIDFSLNSTGICLIDPTTWKFNTWALRPPAKYKLGDDRLFWIYQMVQKFMTKPVTHAVIEGYVGGINASRLGSIGEGTGIWRLALRQAKIPLITISPSAVKKWGFGSGNTPKDTQYALKFQRAWKDRYPWNSDWDDGKFDIDDKIDAFLIATMCLAYHGKFPGQISKIQQGVLKDLLNPKKKSKKKKGEDE